MFNLKEFVVKNIVNGIKNGTFSKEYGNIMAVNYLVKGILTEDDVASIDAQITAWEEELASANVDVPEEVITESEEITVSDEPVTEEPDAEEEVTEPTEEEPAESATEPETNEPEETENETVSEESEPENTETETDSGENETVE